ncbi:hypothetical protein C7C46_07070 [Streptomyces tateyamensis]|uniref:DUF4232 domain-containing protein n=1 Tax=Streptomyces tateyamensis TaxID=565073 RepID=A0A2V4P5R1_9ACTN|nr:hypothetical protein [Streptomyces tateyamensis]PYC85053.1 hypothetical protein C7C46_07070 [Streptomyces tateyamensis]
MSASPELDGAAARRGPEGGSGDSLWIEPTPAEPAPSWGEEQAVRALLHRAVTGVQPAADALARIQRAVPARRAHRRRVRVGALAAALVSAVAVPTLSSMGAFQLSDGSTSTGPVPALSSTSPGTGSAVPPSSESVAPVPAPGQGQPGSTSYGGGSASSSSAPPSANPTGSAPPSAAGSPTGVPDCGRGDLADGGTTALAPDQTGRVSGTIDVLNSSGHPCVLVQPGSVYAADSSGSPIQVVAHVVNDPAGSLLPNPAAIPALPRVMPAGSRYQLPWAWVPDQSCPTAPASPRASASPAATAAPASPGPAATGAASSSPPPTSPSPTQLPSTTITLSHRPLYAGSPVGTFAVTNTCPAGRLYVDPPLVGQ